MVYKAIYKFSDFQINAELIRQVGRFLFGKLDDFCSVSWTVFVRKVGLRRADIAGLRRGCDSRWGVAVAGRRGYPLLVTGGCTNHYK